MVVESIFMRVMESRQVRTVRDTLEGESGRAIRSRQKMYAESTDLGI